VKHPTKQELNEYCRRALSPASFLSVHRHVATCPHCAAQCRSPQQLERDLTDLHAALLSSPDATPYHLSAAEAAAYVRGTLDEIDLEIAESHLETCPTCVSEVQSRKPVHVIKPKRLRIVNGWQPWRVAAVVFCGALLILLALWLLHSRPAEQKEQAAWPASQSTPNSSPNVQAPADLPNQSTPPVEQAVPDVQFWLVLNDAGGKVTLDKQDTLGGLERLPTRIQQKIRAVLQAGRFTPSSALVQLASRPSALLSKSGNGLPFRLVGPLGEVVRTQQPTFRWRALAGAQSYKVIVTDGDLNEVATSQPLNTTEWRITKPLKEGGVYSWQVTAMKDGVAITSPVLPAPQAKFRVIDHATLETLKQSERAYPDSHLTRGVLYAEAGLLDEAEQELRMLVHNNPQAGVARKLLRSVQAMRTEKP
jgi:hypothetical protein